MTREFAYQTTGLTTKDQIAYRNNMTQKQNDLAKSGGGPSVPQFRESGLSPGPGANDNIKQLAGKQMQMDANSKYNSCVGKNAGACGGSRRRPRRTRKSQKQLKNKKKYYKI
jgi:hypothetical protein